MSEAIDIALAEYNALRAEILATLDAKDKTVTFGVAALTLLITITASFWSHRALVAIVLMAIVPLVSMAALVQWIGKIMAIERLGAYIEGLESALRTMCEPLAVLSSVMRWERYNSVRSQNWCTPDYRWLDVGAVVYFPLIAGLSIALGAYRAYGGHETAVIIIAAVEGVLLLGTTLTFGWTLVRTGDRGRASFHTEFGSAAAQD